jgi:hypothetical protein
MCAKPNYFISTTKFSTNPTSKFPPQYCYYTDGLFTSPKKIANNIWEPARARYGIWNPLLKINISKRLIGLQNILHTEISAIFHTLTILNQEFPHEPPHIFTDNLSSLYLINTQIKHPTQQNTLHKVRAHTNVIGNKEADKLAKESSKIELENDMPTQPHEDAYSTPYWWCREDDHPYKGPIRHPKSYLEKVEKESNEELAKTFDNINKWVNDPHINNKIFNNFWTNPTVTNALITQLLKFQYGQYMGNE